MRFTERKPIKMLVEITQFLTAISPIVLASLQVFIIINQNKNAKKLEVVHNLVNSQSEKLNKAIEVGSFEKGKQAGALEERANPLTPNTGAPSEITVSTAKVVIESKPPVTNA